MPYDFGLFDKQVMSETHRLALILKAHLWLESCLNHALEVAFHDPSRLKLERESFARKIGLAGSLHAIPPGAETFLTALNKLRNSIAHQLEYEVGPDDFATLRRALRGTADRMYANFEKTTNTPDLTDLEAFKHMILFMVMAIEHFTMMQEYRKVHRDEISTYGLLLAVRERVLESNSSHPVNESVIEGHRPPPPPHPREVWADATKPLEGTSEVNDGDGDDA